MLKTKYFFCIFVLFVLVNISFAQGQSVYDNANLFSDVSELEILANEINSYKNHGARIVIYTVNSDQDLYDLYSNGFENNDLGSALYEPNLNVFVIYKAGLEYPIFIFSKNCGLDKDELNYVFSHEYVEDRNLPVNSDMFVQVTDPDGKSSYTLGVTPLLAKEKYQEAFVTILRYLYGQIKEKVDLVDTSDKYKYCPIITRLISGELYSSSKPDAIAVHPDFLRRLKPIEDIVEDAVARYPGVSKELELAKIARESSGFRTQISDFGAYGYSQLLPCTAKDLGLVKKPVCKEWKLGVTDRTNPCSDRCKVQGLVLQEDIDNILDARKNIFAGTRYLDEKIRKCKQKWNIPDKYELIKCGLASYNAGPVHVKNAIRAAADSTLFEDYSAKLPRRQETVPYVDDIIGYMVWLEQNPDAVAEAT